MGRGEEHRTLAVICGIRESPSPSARHWRIYVPHAYLPPGAIVPRPSACNPQPTSGVPRMSTLEYHVLLALAGGPLHGYAVKQRVEDESAGSLTPQPGSLYRVIARLMTSGLVAETDPKGPRVPASGIVAALLRAHRLRPPCARGRGAAAQGRGRAGGEAPPDGSAVSRVLAALVRLFPTAFRERFGPEIVEHVREDWAAARARGRLAALAYALAAALDLVGAALAEHWKPSLRSTPRSAGGGIMRWLSGRLDPGPAPGGARAEAHAGLHAGRGRDARPRARRDRGHLQHRGRGAAPPAAVPPARSAGVHRRHRARVRSPQRIRPPGRVLPPVSGRVEAAPGPRTLRRLHQHPAGGRPCRAGADGDLPPPRSFPRSAWRPSWAACRSPRTRTGSRCSATACG